MKLLLQSRNTWILIILAAGLLIYTSMRASTLSMTHDESSTYLNSIDKSLFTCFYSSDCWGTANIHLLNSMLMQGTVGLLGPTEFAIRLPNLLTHLLYLICSILLIRALSNKFWIMLGGFLLLNVNPYLLEFFALARGYGMGCGFVMMSVYFLYRFLERKDRKSLIGTFAGSFLAVMSNFTFLNYFAVHLAFFVFAFLVLVSKSDSILPVFLNRPFGEKIYHPLIFGGATAGLLFLLLYYPIKFLRRLGEFNYGVDSLWETFEQLINDSVQGAGYFSAATTTVFMWVFGTLVGISVLYGLYQGMKPPSTDGLFYFAISFFWLTFVLATIVQYYLLDTNYLVHRTALIFIPLNGLPVYLFLENLKWKKGWISVGLAVVLSLFSGYHLLRVGNTSHSREWSFEAKTRDMVDYISKNVSKSKKIKLGVSWIFSHTTEFYRQTRNLVFIEPIIYEKEVRSDNFYDYYYIPSDQAPNIHSDYILNHTFFRDGVLYQKQESALIFQNEE